MKQIQKYGKNFTGWYRQRGGLTIFTAILVLILMTALMVYATRTSIFETRVSGNEMRQKEAFHVAEAALDQNVMYLLQNSSRILSSGTGFPDGRDGWFATGNTRWQLCSSHTASGPHPCDDSAADNDNDGTEDALAYFYEADGNLGSVDSMLINETDFPTGTTARVSAVMCFINLGNPTNPCGVAPTTPTAEAEASLVLTLLSYGFSDCTDVTDVSTCQGEATVALPIANWKKLAGSPGVPLVSKSEIPISGTVEVVGNPNGGGLGVPLTTWVDGNQAKVSSGCNGDAISAILSDGTWQTCELGEWYQVGHRPEGVMCTDNNCGCVPPDAAASDTSNFLSYRKNSTDCLLNIDIIEDYSFPPDLFEFYFGVPRQFYPQIKNTAQWVEPGDCDTIGMHSSGLIWVNRDGTTKCNLVGSKDPDDAISKIGSPLAPVILVSAADETVVNGGVNIFGVLYIFDDDPPGSSAELSANGGAVVYGAVIVDAQSGLNGGFTIVYNEAVLASASGIAGLGSVNGGWRDFGLPDIPW